jgi:uncharacterized protein (DUF2062 family)
LPIPSILQRRIVQPVKRLLIQGVTPRKVALSLACGATFGLFPIMGSTTLLCTFVAALLGLNLPMIQTVNLMLYPAQLALIVPFIRAGQFLLHSDRTRLTLAQMVAMSHGGIAKAFHLLWRLALAGVTAWTLFAAIALPLLYWGFLVAVLRIARALPSRRQSFEPV